MTNPRVAIVHLGRASGMGGLRRVDGMANLFRSTGADVAEVRLRVEHPASWRDVSVRRISDVFRGSAVPESLSWSLSEVGHRLKFLDPDLVICETARAYSERLPIRRPILLDFVDQLSTSYADRARTGRTLDRVGFKSLTVPMRAFERRQSRNENLLRLAVGWTEARSLNADWLPLMVDSTAARLTTMASREARDRGASAVFFGNLSYAPNVEAVLRLGRLWPMIDAQVGGATLTIAGARPAMSVRKLAEVQGWNLQPDVADMAAVLSEADLALVPLLHASGMQTKVLEAAVAGLPQVISAQAAAGFAPGLPVTIARDDAEFVRQAVDLLRDPDRQVSEGAVAQSHVLKRYSIQEWTGWAIDLIESVLNSRQ